MKKEQSLITSLFAVAVFISLTVFGVWLQAWIVAMSWNYGIASITDWPTVSEAQVFAVEIFMLMWTGLMKKLS